ncbi:6608_t:CDS:2 [Diversispora eburnea]|uniref:SWR1-complex protein 4 n=1 Tax=Diversispora eburnea TaxID=1213867 RepID=A0A9N9BPF4_9GLOM|nr:6608_t:CDS:2 [Diversispora eburnea]
MYELSPLKPSSEDKDWTREETDYLFSLCKKYDLRFMVILDRCEYPNKRKKSILSNPTTPTMEITNSIFRAPMDLLSTKKNRRTSSPSIAAAASEVHNIPTTVRREKFPPGVVDRVSRMPLPKQAMAVKVTKALQEFGLGPRPTIPTEIVCARWTELQKAIQTLLEIKKGVDKHEHELKIKVNLYKKISSADSDRTINGSEAGSPLRKRDRITLSASSLDVKRARK